MGSSRNRTFKSMCIKEIGTPGEIPASVPTNDDAQNRFYIMYGKLSENKQQFLYYTQPLKKGKFAACEYSFETNPFCHASAKKERKYSRIPVIAKFSSVYTKICMCHKLRTRWRNRRYLHSEHRLLKLKKLRKITPKINVKNIQKIESLQNLQVKSLLHV